MKKMSFILTGLLFVSSNVFAASENQDYVPAFQKAFESANRIMELNASDREKTMKVSEKAKWDLSLIEYVLLEHEGLYEKVVKVASAHEEIIEKALSEENPSYSYQNLTTLLENLYDAWSATKTLTEEEQQYWANAAGERYGSYIEEMTARPLHEVLQNILLHKYWVTCADKSLTLLEITDKISEYFSLPEDGYYFSGLRGAGEGLY